MSGMYDLPEHLPPVRTETLQFLGSLLVGIPAGLLLDTLRTLRAFLPHHPLAVFLEDFFYSAACGVMVAAYAWGFCGSVLRWYLVLGAGIGLVLYLVSAGAVWMRMLAILRGLFTPRRKKIPPAAKKSADAP